VREAPTVPERTERCTTNRGTALGFAVLVAVLGVPSSAASQLPEQAPAVTYPGASPVENCPQFFDFEDGMRLRSCIAALAAHGWGLSAIDSRGYTLFAGAFAPARPRRYPFNDVIDQAPDPGPAHVVGLLGGLDGVVTEVKEDGNDQGHCGELDLQGDYGGDTGVVGRSTSTYVRLVSEEAAHGCVPADFAIVAGQEDEGDRYIALFVRGDPRAFGSILLASEAANAAFEKRAAAKGFQPIIVRDNYELWGRTPTPHRIDRHVSRSALFAHVRAGFESGATVTSLSYSDQTATIVWTLK
jgi:hypothetical protein